LAILLVLQHLPDLLVAGLSRTDLALDLVLDDLEVRLMFRLQDRTPLVALVELLLAVALITERDRQADGVEISRRERRVASMALNLFLLGLVLLIVVLADTPTADVLTVLVARPEQMVVVFVVLLTPGAAASLTWSVVQLLVQIDILDDLVDIHLIADAVMSCSSL